MGSDKGNSSKVRGLFDCQRCQNDSQGRLGLKKISVSNPEQKEWFYHLFEFEVAGAEIAPFELEFRRDDSIMRYLTVKLDKHAIDWSEKRKSNLKSANN